jgi:hypothetical protein
MLNLQTLHGVVRLGILSADNRYLGDIVRISTVDAAPDAHNILLETTCDKLLP